MKEQPQNQALGASETARFFCTRISSAASAAGELCTGKRKEPDMAKRENEGKKERNTRNEHESISHAKFAKFAKAVEPILKTLRLATP